MVQGLIIDILKRLRIEERFTDINTACNILIAAPEK